MATFANSVDPDETAHNEHSHQDPHCLPFCYQFLTGTPDLQQWVYPNSEIGRVHFRNSSEKVNSKPFST